MLECKPSSLEDCTIIEVEEDEDGDNVGVPMFVKHTEAMLDEIDRMVFPFCILIFIYC